MALYHVSLAGMNRSKIARTPGVVRTLLATAEARDRGNEADADAAALRKLAVMSLANLAGCPEGRAALMDGGAVAAIGGMMRSGSAAPGDGGVGRDMARRTLRAMRGEDDEVALTASGILGREWDDASVVSEGMVSLRRPPHHRSNYAGPSGSNTTQF